MLSEFTISKLKANWGDKAEALACYAEARLFDPECCWECYVLAMNPEDGDTVKFILVDEHREIFVETYSLERILGRYNGMGEYTQLDHSFIPRQASAIFKTLNERYPQNG